MFLFPESSSSGYFNLLIGTVLLIFLVMIYLALEEPVIKWQEIYHHRPGSYDLFDTLGARRRYSDVNNYRVVAEKFGLPTFVQDRRKARGARLADIYRAMPHYPGVSHDQLMEAEIQAEIDNIIPIKRHINMMEPGDYIVSDTYYDKATIERVVAKLGLDPSQYNIFATPDGKRNGWVWRKNIHHSFQGVACHIGDNKRDDSTCSQIGILPIIHEVQKYTDVEKLVRRSDKELAYLMRETRLANPYKVEDERYYLWEGQSQYNLPIMLLSCYYVDDWASRHGITRIRGMLRDCCLFGKLFARLYGDKYDYQSILISRKAMNKPSKHTMAYFKEHLADPEHTLWIDGNGTGCGYVNFIERNKFKSPHMMNIFRYWSPQTRPGAYRKKLGSALYNWLSNFHGDERYHDQPFLHQVCDDFWGDFLEMFNCDINGSFKNFKSSHTETTPKIERKKLEYPKHVAEIGHGAFDDMMNTYFEQYHGKIKTKAFQIPELIKSIHMANEKVEAYWVLRAKYHCIG